MAYGFMGFASAVVLYITMTIFWTVSMLNILFSIGLVQTYLMVFFIQFSAGFFAQIAIYEKYCREITENSDNSKLKPVKIRNYGLFGGLFTGLFIFLFPAVIILLVSFGNSGMLHTFTIMFNNFFPYVISGIIGGAAGSYYASSLLKKGFSSKGDLSEILQRKYLTFVIITLLIVFVPIFFGLAAAHLHEPEVIRFGEYDSYNLSLLKIDQDGNILWETDPITTTNTRPGLVVQMENGSYALFGYEPSTHGGLNTLTYISEDGTFSDPINFLISDGEIGSPVEIPGSSFLIADYGKYILRLDYNGSITGQYSIPGSNQNWYYLEMVPADGNRTLVNWEDNYAFMDDNGNFSGIRSFPDKEYIIRPYRMTTKGMATPGNGEYITCLNDDESGELKAIWLDDSLNPVKEEIIGTSHASYVSVDSNGYGDVILVQDIDRPEDYPENYKEYFHVYYPETGNYYDVMTGNFFPEIFINGDSGYTLFSVQDKWLSDEKEVTMEICDFDESCSDSVKLVEGKLKGVKIMQTSDGGYLLAYLTEGVDK